MTDDRGGFYSAEDADSVPPSAAEDRSTRTQKTQNTGTRGTLGAEDGRGVLHLAACRSARVAWGGQRRVRAAVWTPARRQCAVRSAERVHRARICSTPREGLPRSPPRCSATPEDVAEALTRARVTLFHARLKRPRPHLDDKVLTSWNGLMIAAFARASRVLADGGVLGVDEADVESMASRGCSERGVVSARHAVGRRTRDAAASISQRAGGDRRLRRGLRVSRVRAARAVSGRRRSALARMGAHAAAAAGRTVLGRRERPAGSARPVTIRRCCCA